jgi:hypothetical protein
LRRRLLLLRGMLRLRRLWLALLRRGLSRLLLRSRKRRVLVGWRALGCTRRTLRS